MLEPATWANNRFQQQKQQHQEEERQREQLRREQLQQQHFPSQLWNVGWPQSTDSPSFPASSSSASSRFFDFLQRPDTEGRQHLASQQLLDDANKSLNADALGLSLGRDSGGGGAVTQHQHTDGNEIANEKNHENGSRKALPLGKSATGDVDNVEDDAEDQDDMLDELKLNWSNEQSDDLDIPIYANNANARLPWRLIYRMHKNRHYAN